MYKRIITASVVYVVAIIVIAHLAAPEIYDWTVLTISHLGAQNYENAWLMRLGFIGFGILLNLGLIVKAINQRKLAIPDIFLMVYGGAIFVTGFFSIAPFDGTAPPSPQHDELHSLFATIAGISFSIGIFVRFLTAKQRNMRWFHLVALILVGALSFPAALLEGADAPIGIAQRLLWIVSFSWLLIAS